MALRLQSGDRREVAPRRAALQLQRPLLGQLHVVMDSVSVTNV
jgi:hypothetical protein